MTAETTGSFITIDQSNINNKKTSVKQLVDIVQSDIANTDGSSTRKSYEVFTSGGTGLNPITSSLYQTVFDQDFTLGTSNPLFDVTIGSLMEIDGDSVSINGETAPSGSSTAYALDSSGKLKNPGNETAMIREKVNIYKQFSQNLLGDSNSSFFTPHGATAEVDLAEDNSNAGTRAKKIKGALFICFRRLFTRDNIDKKTFVMSLQKNASKLYSQFLSTTGRSTGSSVTNINIKSDFNSGDNNIAKIIDDTIGKYQVNPKSGEVSTLQNDDGHNIGLIFYDSGIIVLDIERAFDATQTVRGAISATAKQSLDTSGPYIAYGYKTGEDAAQAKYYYPVYTVSGGDHTTQLGTGDFNVINDDANTSTQEFFHTNAAGVSGGQDTRPSDTDLRYPLWSTTTNTYYSSPTVSVSQTLHNGSLFPSLWVSGTIDDIVDHICTTRFGRDNASSITFRNETIINSSFVFCEAAPSQLNYSTNPSYVNSEGTIIALDPTTEEPFIYVTTVGLYGSDNDLLAVAKTSRPIEKNPLTNLSIRIRLDY
jgi:hypothetical protein